MTTGQMVDRCIREMYRDVDLRRVTAFVSPKETVKATRRHRVDRRAHRNEFLVTIGRPNYQECRWIKALRVAGEPFPVRQLRLTFWPDRRPKFRD